MKKKSIRKILNNNLLSIKRLFNIITVVATVAGVMYLFAIGGCECSDTDHYTLLSFCSLMIAVGTNLIGAVVTRLLYFNGYVKRSNVVRFLFE